MSLECPQCGGQDLTRISGVDERARFECNFCELPSGRPVQFFPRRSEAATVPFQKTKCPHCKSSNTSITNTKKGERVTRRQHVCNNCSLPFNSYDQHQQAAW